MVDVIASRSIVLSIIILVLSKTAQKSVLLNLQELLSCFSEFCVSRKDFFRVRLRMIPAHDSDKLLPPAEPVKYQ